MASDTTSILTTSSAQVREALGSWRNGEGSYDLPEKDLTLDLDNANEEGEEPLSKFGEGVIRLSEILGSSAGKGSKHFLHLMHENVVSVCLSTIILSVR